MKSFEIQEFGIDQLKLVDREIGSPGAGQVLVRMTAASLNFRDVMMVEGLYNPKLKRPMVPLSDGAGVVEAVGEGVTRFRTGDRVATCFFQKWVDGPPTHEKGLSALGGSLQGVLSEYILLQEDGLVGAPESLSDEQIATLPCAALTAWHALFEHNSSAPGDSILIQGTGGVSTFAMLYARAAGLRSIVSTSSREKAERVSELGADEVINYREMPDWDKEARRLTDGVGVDHVIEVGGSATIGKSLSAVRTHGVISVIGALTGREPSVSPTQILMNSVRVQGIYVGSRAMFERMNRAIELHHLKPVIDRTFAWTEFPDALRHMQSQKHFGKIVLRF